MAFEIRASQLKDPVVFADAVNKHIARLKAHTKTIGKPRPVAHSLVEKSIKRILRPELPDDFVADYKIIDDTPQQPIEHSLEAKKQELLHKLAALITAANHRVISPRKVNLLTLQYNAAMSKEENKRTLEDGIVIDRYKEFAGKFQANNLIAAQAESDIDDLTEANIDSWPLPTFE